MSYYFAKDVSGSFDEAVEKTRAALQAEGFGILTEIDVAATLRKKLDVDFPPYRILGACHPASAYRALQVEDKIGLLLPCNVIVQETADGRIEVAAIDPIASMAAVANPTLVDVAGEVQGRLRKALERL